MLLNQSRQDCPEFQDGLAREARKSKRERRRSEEAKVSVERPGTPGRRKEAQQGKDNRKGHGRAREGTEEGAGNVPQVSQAREGTKRHRRS